MVLIFYDELFFLIVILKNLDFNWNRFKLNVMDVKFYNDE